MDEVRYGIIGTGMMGIEHIGNISALDGARVTAIADPHGPSLDRGEAAVGGPVDRFTDHRDLLDRGNCDAVVIVSPNMTHGDILHDALAAGVHVLVEKPLCTTMADCRRVLTAAEDSDAVLWMGLEYRYLLPVARLIDDIAAGAAGRVRMISIREHRFPFLRKVDNWNRFNRNSGGTLVEKCCHFFDLMNLLAGSAPIRVMASGAQDVNHLDERYDGETPDILDNAYVIVDYANGVRAALDLCMFAEGTRHEQEVCVIGDEAKLEAFMPESVLRTGRRADGWRQFHDETVTDESIAYAGLHHGASYLEHVDFLAAIRSGSPATVTLEDGLSAVAVGLAAHRSIEQGRVIDLDEVLTAD